jgi:hypothetical protein
VEQENNTTPQYSIHNTMITTHTTQRTSSTTDHTKNKITNGPNNQDIIQQPTQQQRNNTNTINEQEENNPEAQSSQKIKDKSLVRMNNTLYTTSTSTSTQATVGGNTQPIINKSHTIKQEDQDSQNNSTAEYASSNSNQDIEVIHNREQHGTQTIIIPTIYQNIIQTTSENYKNDNPLQVQLNRCTTQEEIIRGDRKYSKRNP